MQRDVWRAHGGTVAGVEGRVPLLVLVAKADDRQITLLKQGFGADELLPFRFLQIVEGYSHSQTTACCKL